MGRRVALVVLLVTFSSGLLLSATNGPLSQRLAGGRAGAGLNNATSLAVITVTVTVAATTVTGPAATTVTGPAQTTITSHPPPMIYLSPNSAKPNGTVNIALTGFAPFSNITVTFQSGDLTYKLTNLSGKGFVPDSSGNLLSAFRVPITAIKGNYVITAIDLAYNTASSTFIVTT